ncbi:hypothetical protein BDF14DRAFT_1769946 [Spinellus fusiger]|nr:hypothetical protein BDF14DRAFT_1769946 [Spinellus fusiger]
MNLELYLLSFSTPHKISIDYRLKISFRKGTMSLYSLCREEARNLTRNQEIFIEKSIEITQDSLKQYKRNKMGMEK